MQTVSQDYAESMKSPLRNRGYIQVSFGIVDESVQNDAEFANTVGTYLDYSDDSEVFHNQNDDYVYATLENNFFKLDGSQYFLPSPNAADRELMNTGVISNSLVANNSSAVIMAVVFDSAVDWYGLTIDFGENYPTSFDILYGSTTLEVRNNTSRVYVADQAFTNVRALQFVFRAMRYTNERVRIYNMRFGIGYTMGNDSVMDSSLSRVISPISEFLPQFDFSVTLKNYDRYFDVNNPDSALNFLSTNSTITVQYGYELDDGTIEWVPGQTLQCSEWESDNKTATIRACDFLRSLDSEYLGGTYDDDGKTFKKLAEEVLASAGIEDYTLDSVLEDYSTTLPLPRVSHKEALQLIANACCCLIDFGRDGNLQIHPRPSSITLGSFRMDERDMLSYPKASKRDPVKTIAVEYQRWKKNGTETNVLSEEITVAVDEEKTYYFSEPLYNYRVTIEGVDVSSTVIKESGDYYLTLQFPSGGVIQVDIYAKAYTVVKEVYHHTVGTKGKTIVWSNPLVDSILSAYQLGEWLKDYYGEVLEYEYDTRGNPELDVGDLIWQDDLYTNVLKVMVSEYRLDFRQAFSGKAVTHKMEWS